jgi:hypothetical protein
MRRELPARVRSAAVLVIAVLLTLAPSLMAQKRCYESYVTLSGICPDPCGRGPDCPCVTCIEPAQS